MIITRVMVLRNSMKIDTRQRIHSAHHSAQASDEQVDHPGRREGGGGFIDFGNINLVITAPEHITPDHDNNIVQQMCGQIPM